jgi:signal transduction histidine kinase
VLIEVEDEGCGVPPEALDRIFDRFARADAARTRSDGGVGLGLAIVDAIAKGHGGRCTVTSTGNGSIFALQLPAFTPHERDVLVPYALPPADSAASAAASS